MPARQDRPELPSHAAAAAEHDAAGPQAVGDTPSGAHPVTNGDLARIFHEIGDILEVKGELVFKTVAYHRAADATSNGALAMASAARW